MVVSVTEPKLLIKILHVTFTGGPVKWNDNDMTGKSLKPYDQGRLGLEPVEMFHHEILEYTSSCFTVYVNMHQYQQALFLLFVVVFLSFHGSSRSRWWHVACFVEPEAKDHRKHERTNEIIFPKFCWKLLKSSYIQSE